MDYGKVWPAGYLEIHYELSSEAASASGSSGYSSVGGGCFTYFRTGIGTLVEGVGIGMLLTDLGNYEGFARIPFLGLSKAYAVKHDLSARLKHDGIYAAENHWLVKNFEVEIYTDGVLDQTWTIGDVDSNYGGLFPTKNPGAIPFFGMPCQAVIQADAAVTLHSGDSASASGTANAGWRHVVAATPIAFDTVLTILDPPPNGGGCTVPGLPALSSTDTWDNEGSVSASVTSAGPPGGGAAPEVPSSAGVNIIPIPNLPRRLRRIGDDYSALLIRAALPQARQESGSNCGVVTATDSDERIPQRAQYLDIVPEAPHPFDDAFDDVVECLYGAIVIEGHNTGSNGAFSNYTGAQNPPTGYIPIYTASDPYLRYWDFLCNPHWSHCSFFDEWPVDSDPNPDLVNFYWAPGKHQWQHNALLAGDTPGTDTRNIVPLDAIGSCGGPAGWWEAFVSHNFRQLGLSRWQTVDVAPKVSHAYDSGDAALFSDEDCSLFLGGTITVTPDAAMTVMNVFLDLASYTAEPCMWPQIADQLKLDWTATNIVSVKTFLVGIDDEEVEVPITKNTWTDLPRGGSVEYAGSWGIYNGVDGVVDDTGVDLLGNGISASLMASAETAGAFQLLPGSTRNKLRIEVTVTDWTIPVSIGYPELRRNDGRDPMVMWESGQCAAVMWPDFSCIRFGQESWWNYGTDALRTTPAVVGLGYQTTVIDAFCWANVWLMGVPASTGLAALVTSLFDAVEGNALVDAAYKTAGVLLPGPTWSRFQFAMSNLLAEVPPLCLLPTKERDADWQPTGAWCLDAWSQFIGTLRFAAPGSTEPELRIGGSKVSAIELGWPDGFTVAGASPVVNNHEWGRIRYGPLELATVRPWHGYYWVAEGVESETGAIANCHDAWAPYFRAVERGGNIFVERWPGPRPVGAPESFQVTFTGEDSHPAVSMDPRRTLWLTFMRAGQARLAVSYDDGETVEDLGVVF